MQSEIIDKIKNEVKELSLKSSGNKLELILLVSNYFRQRAQFIKNKKSIGYRGMYTVECRPEDIDWGVPSRV